MKLLIIFTLLSQLLFAAPAFQGQRTFTQPDGSVVTYRMQGDEYLHWLESENGDIILYSEKNRRLEAAVLKVNSLKASGVAYTKKTVPTQKISKEALLKLQDERRKNRLSKMKSRHPSH